MDPRTIQYVLFGGWLAFMVVVIVAVFIFALDQEPTPTPYVRATPPPPEPTPTREPRIGPSAADLRSRGLGILPPVTMPDDNPMTSAKAELGRSCSSIVGFPATASSHAPPATPRTPAGETATLSRSAIRERCTGGIHRPSSTPDTRQSFSGAVRGRAWRLRRSRHGLETSPGTSTRSWRRRR